MNLTAIMNYDNYGDWTETTGPNAPMDKSCSESQEGSSAIAAVKAWTEAGFPASQVGSVSLIVVSRNTNETVP